MLFSSDSFNVFYLISCSLEANYFSLFSSYFYLPLRVLIVCLRHSFSTEGLSASSCWTSTLESTRMAFRSFFISFICYFTLFHPDSNSYSTVSLSCDLACSSRSCKTFSSTWVREIIFSLFFAHYSKTAILFKTGWAWLDWVFTNISASILLWIITFSCIFWFYA